MGKKDRLKRSAANVDTPDTAGAGTISSRFQFFLWICSFFCFAALVLRTDVMTVWPGAEAYALDHALSNDRGATMLSFLYAQLFPLGTAVDATTEAIWLFPRLLSAAAVLVTAFFTYRLAGRLFGKAAVTLGLVAAAASLFLPFFGKVATPDALALCGQAGFLWCAYLTGADRERSYLPPAAGFLFLAGLAAPLSSLIFGAGAIVAARYLTGGSKAWVNLLLLLSIPLMILLLQGGQGGRSYWFWGAHPLGYGRFLGYAFLGMAPLIGFLLAGLRDLFYKFPRGEQQARLYVAGLALSLLAQSLVFPLLLALLAGKQMQLYFQAGNYPWKDWVRGGATVHLILAFLAAFLALAGTELSFDTSGAGFRAALGMAAAYWIFSLFAVVGLYGDKRDFALGGTVLSGVLGVLFFWVQVYPYLEVERSWPSDLAREIPAGLPTYVAPGAEDLSVALPYFRRAGIPVVHDSTTADLHLVSHPLSDSLRQVDAEVSGRVVLSRRVFGVRR